jgi:diphosphomevalonate decarboxylase
MEPSMTSKAIASPNIALIKYWGKKESQSDLDRNIGLNPSISMTLSKAQTVAEVSQKHKSESDDIFINNKIATPEDQKKVAKHLDRIFDELKIKRFPCVVKSENNFPMATGLASSASAFAALTLATLKEIFKSDSSKMESHLKNTELLSSLARRGSGSAARSIEGPFCFWESQYAKKLNLDWKLYDTVLILSRDKKAVSSSQGHLLAQSSPHMKTRLKNLPHRTEKVLKALELKAIKDLGPLIEEEALEMHKIMQSSSSPIDYLLPETKKLLQALNQRHNRDYYWTLDAGPNPHFISERPIREELEALLKQESIQGEIWEDECGYGAKLL